MKHLLITMSIALALILTSCKEDKLQTQNGQPQQREIKRLPQSEPPTKAQTNTLPPATTADNNVHAVVVTEVITVEGYTYLKVKEGGPEYWIAVQETPIKVGDTISYAKAMEMRNFTSRQLNRTFESILFVSSIKKLSDGGSGNEGTVESGKAAETKKAAEDISVEPAASGLTIGGLFAKRDSYSNKMVRIKGKVTKFNEAIMGKNWVHLEDGTGGPGTNDLLVTTQEKVNVGDVVEFEGTIILNKDFGAGYKYELLMEKGGKK